jgi:hypothetical protein
MTNLKAPLEVLNDFDHPQLYTVVKIALITQRGGVELDVPLGNNNGNLISQL